jgi:hypothetical protein
VFKAARAARTSHLKIIDCPRPPPTVATPLQKKHNLAFFMYGGLYQGMAQEIYSTRSSPFCLDTEPTWWQSYQEFCPIVLLLRLCCVYPWRTSSRVWYFSILLKKQFHGMWQMWPRIVCYSSIGGEFSSLFVHGCAIIAFSQTLLTHFIHFSIGVVPKHFRIAFIVVVSFFWLIIFSSLTAMSEKERVKATWYF